MEHERGIILVTGATGRQGGAVARHLLADGWSVRALVRDPQKPAAAAIAQAGAQLVKGDLLDRASLDAAASSAHGVYSVGTPFGTGPESEVAMGVNLAEAAAAAGVEHFVYSSVAGAGAQNVPAWFATKREVEGRIRDLGLPYTIWRPVSFMENFSRQKDGILAGVLRSPLWPESMMYLIAVDDIGRFVALSFGQPDRFLGSAMEIAGDSMTASAAAEVFSRVLGRPVAFEHDESSGLPVPARPLPGEPQPVRADTDACRRLIGDLATLEEWIRAAGWGAGQRT